MYTYVLNNPETANDPTGHVFDIPNFGGDNTPNNIEESESENAEISPSAALKEAEGKESGSEYGGSYTAPNQASSGCYTLGAVPPYSCETGITPGQGGAIAVTIGYALVGGVSTGLMQAQ